MTQAHDRYRQFLESLTPEALGRLGDYVSSDVRFKDPFNDVRGADAMVRVFRHMFETVKDIRFHVTHATSAGNVCLMAWRFEGRIGGKPWAFDGTSVVTFAADGRVSNTSIIGTRRVISTSDCRLSAGCLRGSEGGSPPAEFDLPGGIWP